MLKFARPDYLYLIYVVPILIGAAYLSYRLKKKKLLEFVNPEMLSVTAPERSVAKQFIKNSLFILAYALIAVALANPQVGTKWEEVKQTGIDAFILLDVSNSMKAEDISPNRLEKAKNHISQLIRKLRGDKAGLIIFSGQAFVQFPLTTDYSAASLFLNAADVTSVPSQGTSIAEAIYLSLKSFNFEDPAKKAIVIITDGEDHEGAIFNAVDEAYKKGVKIFTMGIGSPAGAPIPIYDARGNKVGYKSDSQGNMVLTKLDETTLREVAARGGGAYYRITPGGSELDELIGGLSEIEKTEFGSKIISDYEDRYYFFLIPGIILLFLELAIPEKKSAFWTKLNKRLGIE